LQVDLRGDGLRQRSASRRGVGGAVGIGRGALPETIATGTAESRHAAAATTSYAACMPVDDQPGFRIRPAWPDTMVYEESAPGDDGAPRELAFACRAHDEPPQVVVPSQALWGQSMPRWAQTGRAEIMARLRGAGCVPWVFEPDGGWIESPDGRIVVRVTADRDDRCGPWERITVWRGGESPEELTSFTSHGLGTALRFPGGQSVVFDSLVDRAGERQRILVDCDALTFGFHPNERPQPLDELDPWLGNRPWRPMAPLPAPAMPRWRRAARSMGEAVMLVGGLVLTAGGAWMALAAQTPKDRLTGSFGFLFFGACVGLSLRDLVGGSATPQAEDAPMER
jgi:hypothetical protein